MLAKTLGTEREDGNRVKFSLLRSEGGSTDRSRFLIGCLGKLGGAGDCSRDFRLRSFIDCVGVTTSGEELRVMAGGGGGRGGGGGC